MEVLIPRESVDACRRRNITMLIVRMLLHMHIEYGGVGASEIA